MEGDRTPRESEGNSRGGEGRATLFWGSHPFVADTRCVVFSFYACRRKFSFNIYPKFYIHLLVFILENMLHCHLLKQRAYGVGLVLWRT